MAAKYLFKDNKDETVAISSEALNTSNKLYKEAWAQFNKVRNLKIIEWYRFKNMNENGNNLPNDETVRKRKIFLGETEYLLYKKDGAYFIFIIIFMKLNSNILFWV